MPTTSPPTLTITDISEGCNLAADIVKRVMQRGATAAEVYLGCSKGFQVNVRHQEVETLEFTRDTGLSLTVYHGQRNGSVSLSDLCANSVDEAIAKALAIAQYTGEDPFAGLADKELMATHCPDLDLYHPWDITPEHSIDLARECEAKAMAYDPRINNTEGTAVATHESLSVYANSHGFAQGYCKTSHSMSCALIAQANGAMQSNGDYTYARDAHDLFSIPQLAERSAKEVVSHLGARSLTTGRSPVIFRADIAKSLLGHLVQAISGSQLYHRASFLVDKLGQPICANKIQISEHPHLHKGPGSAPFDSEGVLTREKALVTDGILQHYVLSSYSGRQLHLPTTANAGGVRNLTLQADNKTLTELLADMGTGLLITSLMGQGVNIVTGDYSRGITGFWIENGQIAYPVEEVTIASNLQDMWMQIIAVSNDIDTRSNVRTGSILIESMMVAGSH